MQEHEINYKGHDLIVKGFYSPEETTIWRYSDGSGYPGAPAYFEIDEVWLGEWDILSVMSSGEVEELTEKILELYE